MSYSITAPQRKLKLGKTFSGEEPPGVIFNRQEPKYSSPSVKSVYWDYKTHPVSMQLKQASKELKLSFSFEKRRGRVRGFGALNSIVYITYIFYVSLLESKLTESLNNINNMIKLAQR